MPTTNENLATAFARREPGGTTLQNLEAAVAGETYEFTEMYPPMVEQAKAEGHRAKVMLDFANRASRALEARAPTSGGLGPSALAALTARA